jgi:hypothetical protein
MKFILCLNSIGKIRYKKGGVNMESQSEIYVVQGRSGIIFMVTSDYDIAKNMKDSLDKGKNHGERVLLSTWVDGKMTFNDS